MDLQEFLKWKNLRKRRSNNNKNKIEFHQLLPHSVIIKGQGWTTALVSSAILEPKRIRSQVITQVGIKSYRLYQYMFKTSHKKGQFKLMEALQLLLPREKMKDTDHGPLSVSKTSKTFQKISKLSREASTTTKARAGSLLLVVDI